MPNTIEDNLNRLKATVPAIRNSIIAKGGTVNAGDGLEEFPADINTIPTGVTPTLISKTIIENGIYDAADDSADGYSSVTVEVPIPDPPEPPYVNEVQFIDYDGTILHTYTPENFLALSELPTLPSHEGLTCQGWNWTLADAKEYVRNNENVDIGASYITDDGATRYYLTLTEDRKEPVLTLYLKANTTLDIDWGDGSSHSTFSTTSAGFVGERHNYASAGDYVISISVVSGSYLLQTKVSGYSAIISDDKSGVNSSNAAYLNAVRKIEIGNNVEFYGYAFHQHSNLETITIPYGINAKIYDHCFQNCYSLKSVVIPSDVVTDVAYSQIFQNCYSLKSVIFSNNASIPQSSGSLFQNCSSLKRICLPQMSDSSSQQYTFGNCSNLKHVVLPYGIKTIQNYMFENCYSIIEIKLPSTLTKINQYAFSGCSSLRSIKIPPSVVLDAYCFSNCTSLKDVEFEEGFEDLTGSRVFDQCGIENIKFPTTLTQLSGQYIFSRNPIEAVELPDTITAIGAGLFFSCKQLKTCNIPSNITAIPNYMFDTCTGLEYIEIPVNVKSIGDNAFSNCTSLRNIKLNEGLESIGTNVFYSCPKLEKVVFPNSLESIGGGTFFHCTALNSVRFPNTLESIVWNGNFTECISLSSVDINVNSVSGNNTSIFSTCYGLAHVSINKILALDTYAFYRCTSLKQLTIPATVTSIGSSAIAGLSGLEILKFEGSTPPTMGSTSSYSSLPTTCKILVPAGSLEAYTTAAKYPSPSTYTYEEY